MTDTKEDLARREAPCFIYEKEEIVRRCGLLKAALPDVQFLYSVKANPFDPVGTNEIVTIAGNLCTAVDVIAEGITLPTLEVGDLVAVTNAGAYAATLSPTRFSSHPAPQEFLWEGSRRN